MYSLCATLDVDYSHIKRAKKEEALFHLQRENVKQLVQYVYEESNQIFSANKIAVILKDRGINTTPEYVRSIMIELGILSISVHSKKDYNILNPKNKSDSLKMNFNVSSPNKVLVSDTTHVKIKKIKYYICTIIDLYSKK